MNKFLAGILVFWTFSWALCGSVFAYQSPGSPNGYVNDFAGVLSAATEDEVNALLYDFSKNESNEVAVVTVTDLGGEEIEYYASKLFEEWGIGTAEHDNGVLLLVAVEDKKVRLEVGYGLEGTLTDLEAWAIIDGVLLPAFKAGDFDKGVNGAILAIMESTRGE